jgi:hypothetical protein
MTSLRLPAAAAILTAALGTACGLVEPTMCTAEAVPGSVVEISDSLTGEALTGPAAGEVREGTHWEHLVFHGSAVARAATERPGRYDVEVRHAGYRTWTMRGVRVVRDVCHVRTVTLQARLQRLP